MTSEKEGFHAKMKEIFLAETQRHRENLGSQNKMFKRNKISSRRGEFLGNPCFPCIECFNFGSLFNFSVESGFNKIFLLYKKI